MSNSADALENAKFSDILPALKKKFSATVESIADGLRDMFTGADGKVGLGAFAKNTAAAYGNFVEQGQKFGRGGKFCRWSSLRGLRQEI